MSTSFKHLMKEQYLLRKLANPNFINVEVSEDTNTWTGNLVVENPVPYNEYGMKIEISFPPDYPFGAPHVRFLHPIYHPIVDEKGNVCVPILLDEHWRATHTHLDVIQSLVEVITTLTPETPVRPDVAQLYNTDRQAFENAARAHLIEHGAPIQRKPQTENQLDVKDEPMEEVDQPTLKEEN